MQKNVLTVKKLKVNDTYKRDEKIATKFEPFTEEDVVKSVYLDTETFKVEGQLSSFKRRL